MEILGNKTMSQGDFLFAVHRDLCRRIGTESKYYIKECGMEHVRIYWTINLSSMRRDNI